MQFSLRLISLFLLLACVPLSVFPQDVAATYPDSLDQRVRYELDIDMPKAHVSGILIMHKSAAGRVNASVVNEFGISLMDFTYDEIKDKIKFYSLTPKLDRWYIRRTLKSDLRNVMRSMREGSAEYVNAKRKIKYSFRLAHETD